MRQFNDVTTGEFEDFISRRWKKSIIKSEKLFVFFFNLQFRKDFGANCLNLRWRAKCLRKSHHNYLAISAKKIYKGLSVDIFSALMWNKLVWSIDSDGLSQRVSELGLWLFDSMSCAMCIRSLYNCHFSSYCSSLENIPIHHYEKIFRFTCNCDYSEVLLLSCKYCPASNLPS
jgi:hypothetical protein